MDEKQTRSLNGGSNIQIRTRWTIGTFVENLPQIANNVVAFYYNALTTLYFFSRESIIVKLSFRCW